MNRPPRPKDQGKTENYIERKSRELMEAKAENAELKKLIKGNEEICRQRNRELLLHKAAAKAARSGLKTDLDAYLKLLKENDNG